jgi:hypothetical protein
MYGQSKRVKSSRRLKLVLISILLLMVSATGLDCNIENIENIYKDEGKANEAK